MQICVTNRSFGDAFLPSGNRGLRIKGVPVQRRSGRCGFAFAPAYGSEVVAFGDAFIQGTEVPCFYPRGALRLFWFLALVGGVGRISCLYETWGTPGSLWSCSVRTPNLI